MPGIDWVSILVDEDVERLWNGLYQLITRHPAVRPLRFATDGAAVTAQTEINADLTQELFLELFQKQRFEHYLKSDYSSSDIENELAHIEVPNLVGARLRKRYPESFRMARRVSALLKASPRFRRFAEDAGADRNGARKAAKARPGGRSKKTGISGRVAETQVNEPDVLAALTDSISDDAEAEAPGRRRRMVNQLYGLRKWAPSKPVGDAGRFGDLVKNVAMRRRDTRLVGRSGASQLILSNAELEELIVDVFKAIDSPCDVRTIRQLALSKIPLQDYNIASLDEEFSVSGSLLKRDPSDTRSTPEDELLEEERDQQTAKLAENFLVTLRRAVNDNERRYTRLVSTLWHCYYNPKEPSQLEIARMLGVSDSLVSDNRRLIEYELKKLQLSMQDGPVFSETLRQRIAAVG